MNRMAPVHSVGAYDRRRTYLAHALDSPDGEAPQCTAMERH